MTIENAISEADKTAQALEINSRYINAIRRGRKEALERASEIIKAKGKEAIDKNAKWGAAEICEFCVDLIEELEKIGGIRMPDEEEKPVDEQLTNS